MPTNTANLLIVEDEAHLATGLQFNLEAEGYTVSVAGKGEEALDILAESPERFDLVLLDVMLPGVDGFTVASQLRERGQYIPVLMLTALGRPEDVLLGFAAGADDYLAKPFDLPILIARVNGLLRRLNWNRSVPSQQEPAGSQIAVENGRKPSLSGETYHFDGRQIDFLRQELRAHGKTYRLTLMETELLRYLITRRDKPVSRKAILEDVWQLHEDTDTRAIDNFVARLRKYIEDNPAEPRYLLTVRGVGYRFSSPASGPS